MKFWRVHITKEQIGKTGEARG
ncbi:MAG: hypothetical protein RLZZ350_594, partial [Verrucomicrobiota bacterium]